MKERCLRYISGEIHMTASGGQLLRMATLLIKKGVVCRQLRTDAETLQCIISVKDQEIAAFCAKKTGCVLSLWGERGPAACIRRYRGRLGFGIAGLLCLGLMMLSSQLLWDIHIEGLNSLSQTELRTRLAEYGIREGIWCFSIDTETVRKAMLLAYPDLAWLSLSVEGSSLWVRVTEITEGPELLIPTEPSDLVATKNSIIYSIITEKGTPKVQKGDVVQAGDPLIEGSYLLQLDDGTEWLQRTTARGRVYGQCRYELVEEMEYVYEKKIYEKTLRGWTISWGENTFSLKNPFRSLENYDTIEEDIFTNLQKCLRILSGCSNLSIRQSAYYPYTTEMAEYSEEELEERLRERLENRKTELLEESQGILLAEEYQIEDTASGRRATLVLTLMEDIGQSVPWINDESEEEQN